MKRSGLTPLLLSATLFLLAPATVSKGRAQDMKDSMAAPKGADRAAELLKRFDKNGDGKLDDDERAEAKELMMKEQIDRQVLRLAPLPGGLESFRVQVLAMFDRNRDGRLDDKEREAARKFAASRAGPSDGLDDLTRRFDKNGDGRIDREERAQIDAFLVELRALGSEEMRSALLGQLDRNADGKVDEAESGDLERLVRSRMEANPAQLRRFDTNNDGKLDDPEWMVARTAILQWLNGNGPAALESASLRSDDPTNLQRGTEEGSKSPARGGNPGEQGIQSIQPSRDEARELARLQLIATEVERRRAERAGVPKFDATAK